MKSEIFPSVCFTLISLLFSSYNIKSTWSIRVNTSLTDRIPWKPIPTPVNRRGYVSSSEDAVSFPSPNLNTYTSQPVLKQRENGASLGLDIPESNLRLWLNIDELSGPKGENVRLKLLDADSLAKSSSTPRYSAPLIPPLPPSSPSGPAPTGTLSAKLQKKYQIGYIRATDLHSALNSGVLPPGSKAYPVPPPPVFLTHNTNSMRKQQQQPSPQPQLAHLPIPISSLPSSHPDPPSHQHRHHPQNHPLPPHLSSSSFMESISSSASNGGFAQPILKYSQPLQSDSLSTVEKHVNNYPSSSNSVVEPQQQPFLPINQPSASPSPSSVTEVTSSLSSSASLSSSSSSPNAGDQIGGLSVAESMSKTNTRPSSPSAPVKSARKKSRNKGSSAARKSSQLQEAPSTTSTTTTTTTTTTTEATSTTSDYKADLRIEQQKQADISEEDVQEVQITQNQQSEQVRDEQQDDDFVGLMQAQIREEPSSSTSTTPSTTTTTTTTTQASAAIKGLPPPPPRAPVKGRRPAVEAQRTEGQRSARLRDVNSVDDSDSSTETEDDDGFELLRMTPKNSTSSSSSSPISDSCSPETSSFSGDAESMTIREFASKLGADALFSKFPAMEDHLQNMVDFMSSGYTLFLPSNEAVERIPRSLVRKLKSDPELLKRMLENHVSEDKRDMSSDLRTEMVMPARVSSGRLRVARRSQTETLHVNGIRILKMNQKGPMGGSVNVIDGLLYPVADRNLMDTLKGCNRFDGFVTLAEGTGLGESLASGGPYTVFVPSNEALQKIPDADLERIRNNMTALKEFLMFHVAQGSYYSADLRDGQFIPSMIPDQDLQVGVRVDGCSRRLVEANVSPLYRADIPATNGVIHVVDWILKPNDRDWCEGVELPRRR